MTVSFGLAFLAGLVSFLSPCVLSLVPAYIGYLSGRSISDMQSEKTKENSVQSVLHGLFFVLGFSTVFIILGVAVAGLGGLLHDLRTWIAKIGGIVVILFGLHMTGLVNIPFLNLDLRLHDSGEQKRSFMSSALMGVFFSAGWSPCVGPVLGTILTLALNSGEVLRSIYLLASYSMGLAIPFMASALGVGWIMSLLRKYGKLLHAIAIFTGGVMILVGLLLFAGTFEQLARFGFLVDFGL